MWYILNMMELYSAVKTKIIEFEVNGRDLNKLY